MLNIAKIGPDYRYEKLETSEQNSNFVDAQRITTESALTDLYIYLFGTKIVEMIDTANARWTVVTLCLAVLFKAIKQLQKCLQNSFCKIAETAIHTESKQKQNILLFTPST